MKLRDLKPGDVWTRVVGGYRYVVTDRTDPTNSGDRVIYCHNLDGESDGYYIGGNTKVRLLYSTGENQSPVTKWKEIYKLGVGEYRVIHKGSEAFLEGLSKDLTWEDVSSECQVDLLCGTRGGTELHLTHLGNSIGILTPSEGTFTIRDFHYKIAIIDPLKTPKFQVLRKVGK